jgi:hypothetical protein
MEEKTEKKPTRHRATRPAEQIVKILAELPKSVRGATLAYAAALAEAAPEPEDAPDPRQTSMPI